MNYSEQLAYWYVRLNGFFPLTNFVLHADDKDQTSDVDMIAVRFPHVFEDVGGKDTDWAPWFAEVAGINLSAEAVGLLVEVKSGAWTKGDIQNDKTIRRIKKVLQRMGIVPAKDVDAVTAAWHEEPVYRYGGVALTKLLIAAEPHKSDIPWLILPLGDVDRFIADRMERYANEKERDRLFFSGDLIQYFAAKAGR